MTRTRPTLAQRVALVLLVLALAETASAGVDTAWVRWYHAPYNGMDFGIALALDLQGNVIVAGKSEESEGNSDFVMLKYAPTGELLWESWYDGPTGGSDYPRALVTDDAGNIYTAGASESLACDRDMFTLKYGPDGELLWTARHAGPSHDWDEATDIALDDSGNVYVTGWESYLSFLCRYVTIKYDSAGNEQWVAFYQGEFGVYDRAYGIAVAPDGSRIFVTGESARETGEYDLTTICYNRDGSEDWAVRDSGPDGGGGSGMAIALGGSGGVYVGGQNGNTAISVVIVAYDSTGNERWVARYVGPEGLGGRIEALAVDSRGNVCGTGSLVRSGWNSDFVTLKYDPAGRLRVLGQALGRPGPSDGPGVGGSTGQLWRSVCGRRQSDQRRAQCPRVCDREV